MMNRLAPSAGLLAAVIVSLAGFSPQAHAHGDERGPLAFISDLVGGPYEEAMTLMSRELVHEARPHVAEQQRRDPTGARTHLLEARLHFLDNDFDAALAAFDKAKKAEGHYDEQAWDAFGELVRNTQKTAERLEPHKTSSGHFIVHVEPGVDEVLLPYADEALEAAYDAFGEIFDYQPSEPVHVHVYPRVQDLAAVSALKVSEIENSGTIALCKHNRLMITSPRDMLFGYDWLDTLAHEYIHYVIIKKSHNTVPIWLHEGMAKFFENRWRERTDGLMLPTSQDILAKGLEDDDLVTFAQMSPSMAKLPTQEKTALAFAEVFTAMKFIKDQKGLEGVQTLIDRMRDGRSDRQAISDVLEMPFDQFQREWRLSLNGLELMTLPTSYTQKLYFKHKNVNEDELEEIGQEEAKKHTYLGDRLRAKDRLIAASKEYLRAVDLVGDSVPVIQAKLAATWNRLGEYDRALTAVLAPLKYYPGYVLLHLNAAKAYLAKRDYDRSRAFFESAVRINPFDVEIHAGLVDIYDHLGLTELADRERAAIRILEGKD